MCFSIRGRGYILSFSQIKRMKISKRGHCLSFPQIYIKFRSFCNFRNEYRTQVFLKDIIFFQKRRASFSVRFSFLCFSQVTTEHFRSVSTLRDLKQLIVALKLVKLPEICPKSRNSSLSTYFTHIFLSVVSKIFYLYF